MGSYSAIVIIFVMLFFFSFLATKVSCSELQDKNMIDNMGLLLCHSEVKVEVEIEAKVEVEVNLR